MPTLQELLYRYIPHSGRASFKTVVPWLELQIILHYTNNQTDRISLTVIHTDYTYSFALCNIAATGAPDGSFGLFFERNSAAEGPFCVQTDWDFGKIAPLLSSYPAGVYDVFPIDQWERDLERGPLNRRAWVMQERFLSTRVLHFTPSQVFWECLANTSGELFPGAIPQMARPFWSNDSQRLRRVVFQSQNLDDDEWKRSLYISWQIFVRAYTRCGLSKDGDKLVAINGVVQLLSKMAGIKFTSGLWHDKLLQELCWMRYTDHDDENNVFQKFYPQNWRAPSWSWASTNVRAHPSSVSIHIGRNCLELQAKVSIEEIAVDAHGSGQLKHASLTLRGRPLNVTYANGEGFSGSPDRLTCGLSVLSGEHKRDLPSFIVVLDNPDPLAQPRGELVFLCIYSCSNCTSSMNRGARNYLVGLALQPHDAAKHQYKRIGLIEMIDPGYNFYMQHRANQEHSITMI
ncbi:hypothetical protein V8C37DRAFT_410194 [Trichoderma ceciliae]